MKKIYYLLLLALPLIFQSCFKDDDDIFDKPASQRMEERLMQDQQILMGATNGWIMEYFPEKEQSYGGYTMFIKFGENNSVTVASELGKANQTETSMYELIPDSGPVLTFNTHNSLFHYFSDPSNPDGIGPVDSGMGGDYEFMVVEATAEKVYLKGKKTGNTIIMTPIATDISWTDLMQKYIDMANIMNSAGASFSFTMGDIKATATMNYRTLLFSYPGEESYEAATASFRVTTDGIAFYKPLQIGGKEITGMKYVGEDENMILTFTDEATGATMHDTWPALSELFFSGKWYFAKSLMSDYGKGLWTSAINKLYADPNGYYDIYWAHMGVYSGLYGFCFAPLDTPSTFARSIVSYTYGTVDDNHIWLQLEGRTDQLGIAYVNAGVSDILKMIGSLNGEKKTFTLTADNPKNPSVIQLQDNDLASNYFMLVPFEVRWPNEQ